MPREYSSDFRGVYWDTRRQVWLAYPCDKGRRVYLGGFKIQEEAAAAVAAFRAIHPRTGPHLRRISAIGIYDDDRPWCEIELSKGKVALIDRVDLPKVMFDCWSLGAGGGGYAVKAGPNKQAILMHRVIVGLPPGRYPEVDHHNHDGLDNRRENLRITDRSHQMGNTRLGSQNTSGFKGVSLDKTKQGWRWKASIRVNGREVNLGRFALDDKIEAARAYDRAALKAFGEFARINGV
jgi:hypothetical protein